MIIIIFIIFILSALLGGHSIYEKKKKIKVNDGEQRPLVDNIFNTKSSTNFVDWSAFCGRGIGGVSNKNNVIPFNLFDLFF